MSRIARGEFEDTGAAPARQLVDLRGLPARTTEPNCHDVRFRVVRSSAGFHSDTRQRRTFLVLGSQALAALAPATLGTLSRYNPWFTLANGTASRKDFGADRTSEIDKVRYLWRHAAGI
jgi:hypothetical protein